MESSTTKGISKVRGRYDDCGGLPFHRAHGG